MYKLLIHEATFARIEPDLKARHEQVTAIMLSDDGNFRDAEGGILKSAPDISLAYGTPDVWFNAIAPQFVQTVLAGSDLKWFQSSAAGIEHPVFQKLLEKAGRKLLAAGAKVTGVRRTPGAQPSADAMLTPADVPDALGQVDIVVLSLPHTEATYNTANGDFFAAMASHAMFVNDTLGSSCGTIII